MADDGGTTMHNIIKKGSEFWAVPATVDREILLEQTIDPSGHATGFITSTLEVCLKMKAKSSAERKAAGWDQYQTILDALP